MLTLASGLLCLLGGAAAFRQTYRSIATRRALSKAVGRLYALTSEETDRRRFHAARRRLAV